MLASDIAFTRGSPNVMFEAIASNIPLLLQGLYLVKKRKS